jgi:archaellum biogenesis protein FlaJ (TadC family)
MNLHLYLTCFLVALIGMALQTVLKMKSLQDKARVANISFRPMDYLKNDWLSMTASILTIVLFLFFVDNILNWKPAVIDYIKIGFAFVGYTGSDIASRLFGVVNKKINTVIDVKTNIADNVSEAPKTNIP